uniref:Uncharacterized protein n=1 Tax=Anopheles albimanus TaxID=7167 RepID=A0A182FY17_ANOAL
MASVRRYSGYKIHFNDELINCDCRASVVSS